MAEEPVIIAAAGTAKATATAHAGSVLVTSGDHPPWVEKWFMILHHLKALTAAYAPDASGSTTGLNAAAMAFFTDCYHLREWLVNDASVSVTEKDIDTLFASSVPLQRCEALCNTYKHHTRSRGTTARIRTTRVTSTGMSADVEIDWLSPNKTTVDTLILVQQCLAEWRAFFPTVGITEP